MIDICIVASNELNWLRVFIDYLFANTEDFKLYISDSGSEDGTVKYLKKLKTKYPKTVTYRHTKANSGWVKGINWGISQGDSPYILIANSDILLPKNWFKKLSKHLKKGVGAVGPISDQVSGRQSVGYSYGQYSDDVELLIGFCILTKRKVIEEIGALDKNFIYDHDDYDFSYRIRKKGYSLKIARDVFVKHFFVNSLSANVAREGKDKEGRKLFIEKHGEDAYKKTRNVKPTVVVGIPFYGDTDPEFTTSMLHMQQPGGNGSVIFAKTERTQIAPARNLLAQSAVDYDSQFLLFVDSDMVFGRQSLIRLLQRAADPNVSIVGGLCYKRKEPFNPCIMARDGKGWKYYTVTDPPGLYEVDGIGMGFTLIKTEVFKSIGKPYFSLDNEGLREDLNFCLKAKKKGYRIFADTTVQVGHLGDRRIIDHYFINNKKKQQRE